MEDQNIDNEKSMTNSGSSSTGSQKPFKETFKTGSPDEVRDRVKDVVQKGVAAVAGALKGFADETERSKVPETSKNAIHQAGETVRSTASSITDEAKNLKEPLKEAGHKLSETARDLRATAQEEFRGTKDAIKGGGMSGGSSSGSSSLGSGSLGGSTMAASGSALGSSDLGTSGSSGLGTEMPDISHTPLAQSDRKLQGKDLTSELDEE